MAIFGWAITTLLALVFLIQGLLCSIGASDKPPSKAWQMIAIGLAFGGASYWGFPF